MKKALVCVGVLLILGLALVGVMDPFRLPSAQRAWRDWLALSLCLGLALTASLVSHSAADPQPFLPVLADFTHLAAVSVAVLLQRPRLAGARTDAGGD